MMIRVYDTEYQEIGYVLEYDNYQEEDDLSTGLRTISFAVPCSEEFYLLMQEENYLETPDYRYVIKEVTFSGNDFFEVYAVANVETLSGKFFRAFDVLEQRLQTAYEYCVRGNNWTINYHSNNRSIVTYQLPNVTILEMIYQIADDWSQELWFDTKNEVVHVYDKNGLGVDRGIFYSNQLNLKKLNKQSDTYEYATVLYPYGKDGLTIAVVNNGRQFIENHSYTGKTIEKVWVNEDCDVAEKLKAEAEIYLDSIAQPRASYKVSLAQLGQNVSLGDSVLLIDTIKNIKQKQRVVRIARVPDAPEKSTVELSNIQADFARDFVKKQKQVDKQIAYIKQTLRQLT